MNKVAIVTGGSSGIGYYVCHYLLKSSYTVYEFSRRDNKDDSVKHISVDVTNEKQVSEAIATLINTEQRLDLVVNCAGYGIAGAIEFTDSVEAKRQFDVNFFGMVNVNRYVIEHLRKTKGRIINISSVAAIAAIPFQAYYSASKAAINIYTEALANELRPFGVSVCAIMPGDTSTGFTKARNKSFKGDDIYKGKISSSVLKMKNDERKGVEADVVGKYIVYIALKEKVKPLYTVGFEYKVITFLLKILPCGISNWLIGKLYA